MPITAITFFDEALKVGVDWLVDLKRMSEQGICTLSILIRRKKQGATTAPPPSAFRVVIKKSYIWILIVTFYIFKSRCNSQWEPISTASQCLWLQEQLAQVSFIGLSEGSRHMISQQVELLWRRRTRGRHYSRSWIVGKWRRLQRKKENHFKKETVKSKIMIVLLIYLFCIALIGKDKYDHSNWMEINWLTLFLISVDWCSSFPYSRCVIGY